MAVAPVLPKFQAFTIKFPGLAGQIVTEIGVTLAQVPATSAPAATHSTHALWDTGASNSVISPAVAKALGLTPVGAVNISHAGGTGVSPTYIVNFLLPNNVVVAGILVSEFPGMPGGFQVLVGMDVISCGDFVLTNHQGETCMSFRTPSMACVDYVEEHDRMVKRALPRNQPCFCGAKKSSGDPIKFKHCHGK